MACLSGSLRDLALLSRVCRLFRNLLSRDALWLSLQEAHGGTRVMYFPITESALRNPRIFSQYVQLGLFRRTSGWLRDYWVERYEGDAFYLGVKIPKMVTSGFRPRRAFIRLRYWAWGHLMAPRDSSRPSAIRILLGFSFLSARNQRLAQLEATGCIPHSFRVRPEWARETHSSLLPLSHLAAPPTSGCRCYGCELR